MNRRIIAAAATAAAATIAPLALIVPSAHAGGHGHDCDPTRGVEWCPTPPPMPGPTGPTGLNVIIGTRGNDTMFGTRGADAIFALRGDDRVITRGGDDLVFGGKGDDVLIDSSPAFFNAQVTMRGGRGNDICIGTDNDRFLSCETVIVL